MKAAFKHIAVAIYRWNLSAGITSIVFSALAFIGVFKVLLNVDWPILLAVVVTVIFGTGLTLDKLRFWEAQATVGTVRNQYLVGHLYQKELLHSKYVDLPMQRALLHLLCQFPFNGDTSKLVKALDIGIAKNQASVETHKWEIEPDERVY